MKPPTSPTPSSPYTVGAKKATDLDATPSAPEATPSQETSKAISDEKISIEETPTSVNENSSPSHEVLITQPLSPYFV